jgi:non-heme chloroperoxidase
MIVPIATSALRTVKLVKGATLKVYERAPHGLATTHADLLNADLFAFIRLGARYASASTEGDRAVAH